MLPATPIQSHCFRPGLRPFFGRHGFTLVELLVVIGVTLVLIGLLTPAVQSVREAARKTDCSNRLRNIGLAVHGYEAAYQMIPGPWFNARVTLPAYTSDRGLFFWLLPYLEQQPLADALAGSAFQVIPENQGLIEHSPEIFLCPSAWPAARLMNVASRFSGPEIEGLSISTCDYAGNGGFYDENQIKTSSEWKGVFPVRVAGVNESSGFESVIDGTSNTVMLWETAGGVLRGFGSRNDLDVNADTPDESILIIDWPNRDFFRCAGRGANKTYVRSWLGLRVGGLFAYSADGARGSPLQGSQFDRIINVSNIENGPYSLHPSGVVFSMADGSVRFVEQSIDAVVLYALSSRDRGEVPQ